MFNRKWGAWFETQQQPVDASDVNKERGDVTSLLQSAKGISGYIYDVASSASKRLSESMVETAQMLKNSVEEGKINGIIDKTLLGDFQKEQEKFVQEKNAKKFDVLPDWERELQEELTEYDVLASDENHDKNWDKEIEEMLKEES